MQKSSTLFYFVNDFQCDLSSTENVDQSNESWMTQMDFKPSDDTIKNILDFARSYEVIETEAAGYVEMNLN